MSSFNRLEGDSLIQTLGAVDSEFNRTNGFQSP